MNGTIKIRVSGNDYAVLLNDSDGMPLLEGNFKYEDEQDTKKIVESICNHARDYSLIENRISIIEEDDGYRLSIWDMRSPKCESIDACHELKKIIIQALVCPNVVLITEEDGSIREECLSEPVTDKRELIDMLDDLYRIYLADNKDEEEELGEYLEFFPLSAERFWLPQIQYKCRLDEFDRTGEMFAGYPWVSESCPWPVNKDGMPLYPGVQIDLEAAS